MSNFRKCLTFILTLSFLFSSVMFANAQTASVSSVASINVNNPAIKGVITDYFTSELESIKSNIVDNQFIEDTNVKAYNNNIRGFYSKWYKSIGLNLLSYNLYVDINSIKAINSSTYEVVVTKGVDMVFDSAPNVVQKTRNEKYKFVLELVNNNWKIENFTDLNDETFDLSKRSQDIKDRISTVDSTISEFSLTNSPNTKQSLTVQPLSMTPYQNQVVWYAHNYYYNYNTAFPDFTNHDCTNFASQCINYAGIQANSMWYCHNRYSYSSTWTVVDDLFSYLINYQPFTWQTSSSQFNYGDILQFYDGPANAWDHSAIITYIDSAGWRYYTAHDTDVYDKDLRNVYPSTQYPQVRAACHN